MSGDPSSDQTWFPYNRITPNSDHAGPNAIQGLVGPQSDHKGRGRTLTPLCANVWGFGVHATQEKW